MSEDEIDDNLREAFRKVYLKRTYGVSIGFTDEIQDRITEIAWQRGISVVELLRGYIFDGIKRDNAAGGGDDS